MTVTVHKPQAPVGVPFGDVTVSVMRRRAPVPVVIALGANLGDAEATLFAAVAALDALAGLSDLSVSATFETEPVGGPDQPAYLNCVVKSVGVQGRSTSTSSSGESPGVPRSGVAIWTTSRCPTRERMSAALSWRPGSTSIPRRGFAWEKRSWRSRNS